MTTFCANIACGLEPFSECLRRRREAKHWSYRTLSDLTGISVSSLRRWEKRPDYVPDYRYRTAIRLALSLMLADDHGWWGPS